jgi:hypothetical protein
LVGLTAFLISPEIFKNLEKMRGRNRTIAYAKKYSYPVPGSLLEEVEGK